jgi:8-oxo-dGTP pyrophosphatase MutT (NUDIX family)
MSDPDAHIVPVDRLDLGLVPYRWRFAEDRSRDIAAHFATRRKATPQLWNGRVLMMRDLAIRDGTLRGVFFEVSFAEFMAWRDWNCPGPDASVVNCFSMGALRTRDGAYLLGVMSDGTASEGRIYFPAGTPDLEDVRGDTVDLLGNVVREIAEETGLTVVDYTMTPGWHAVIDGSYVALMKSIDVPRATEEVRNCMLRHIASEPQPELCDIRIVRSAADFDAKMPRVVTAYLSHIWALPNRNTR